MANTHTYSFFNSVLLFFTLPVCFVKREKGGVELGGWGGGEDLGGDVRGNHD